MAEQKSKIQDTKQNSNYVSFKSAKTLEERKAFYENKIQNYDENFIFIVMEPHKRSKVRLQRYFIVAIRNDFAVLTLRKLLGQILRMQEADALHILAPKQELLQPNMLVSAVYE